MVVILLYDLSGVHNTIAYITMNIPAYAMRFGLGLPFLGCRVLILGFLNTCCFYFMCLAEGLQITTGKAVVRLAESRHRVTPKYAIIALAIYHATLSEQGPPQLRGSAFAKSYLGTKKTECASSEPI